jgi:putative ABC transport system permease protein
MKLAAGSWYSEEEDKSLARVVILGSKLKETLFGQEEAVGQTIRLGKSKFMVIGVAEPRGATFNYDMDNMVFMPLRTCQKIVMGVDHLLWIFVKMVDPSQEAATVDEINSLLADRHDIPFGNSDKYDFAVMSMTQAKDMIDTVLGGITLLLVALAAISLLVGGVGIMNIMYVSVTERTYEIGLRKAVGATSRNVLWQFLFETIVITFLGGIMGVILGIGVTFLLSLIATSQGLNLPFIISFKGIALACVFSIGLGLFFGIYPAKKASGFDPIEALRYE